MIRTATLFVILLIPLVYLTYAVMIAQVNDPIKYIYSITGSTAIVILLLTTFISLIKKYVNLIKYRRMIGLYGFFYSLLHFLNFYVFDAEFKLDFVIKESLDKPFIYLGMISFIILIFMAITSKKTLYPKYYKYHRLLYVVLVLVTVHFTMAQKSLSITQWVYLSIIIILLCLKFRQKKNLLLKG